MADFKFFGMSLVACEAVAPDEVVIHGEHNSVRLTPYSGVEELSRYQREQIERAVSEASE